MRCTELSEIPIAAAVARPRPVGRLVGWLGACQAPLAPWVSTAIGALPGLRVAPQTIDAGLGKNVVASATPPAG
jgi:hypothetical protein